eukprot:NODE_10581_length_436_cov_5.064599_g9470_i0.p2 GENE.NODE_10581_length_436_cov_5.064599_g9470_i0~~NODE_10581_length_436_cov_5.064599_g9470_i0.p2  ORF type:complete len:59 (+),score=16.92 NODE_10581_length_436_cov_5.064599_g9470_i0:175-351(+)
MRNNAEGEGEARKIKKQELQIQIKEKQTELDRYQSEFHSLEAVRRDQDMLVAKLSAAE